MKWLKVLWQHHCNKPRLDRSHTARSWFSDAGRFSSTCCYKCRKLEAGITTQLPRHGENWRCWLGQRATVGQCCQWKYFLRRHKRLVDDEPLGVASKNARMKTSLESVGRHWNQKIYVRLSAYILIKCPINPFLFFSGECKIIFQIFKILSQNFKILENR